MDALPPALANPDILHQIFEEFTLYQPCQRSSDYPRILEGLLHRPFGIDTRSGTLASAALVCKTFSEPASRVLWAVLYEGVEPLFRAFSAFKVVKVVDHSKDWLRQINPGLPETYRSKIVRSMTSSRARSLLIIWMAGVGRKFSAYRDRTGSVCASGKSRTMLFERPE